MRCRTLIWVAAAVVLGCGEGPMYCNDCREIRRLQRETHQSGDVMARIDAMNKEIDRKDEARYALRQAAGEHPVDGHPACDCPCHFRRW